MIKLTEEFSFQLITQPKIIQKVFVQTPNATPSTHK